MQLLGAPVRSLTYVLWIEFLERKKKKEEEKKKNRTSAEVCTRWGWGDSSVDKGLPVQA